IYKTLMRPVATYGAQTWTLTITEENALRMFERKIIRKIYGPVMENVGRLYSKRRKGRPRKRRPDDVENGLKKMKVKGWMEKVRNREQWRAVVEEAKAHPGL
ncbi:hypothetical protein B7P43_G02814, partial [Cryptotermes secundus]